MHAATNWKDYKQPQVITTGLYVECHHRQVRTQAAGSSVALSLLCYLKKSSRQRLQLLARSCKRAVNLPRNPQIQLALGEP